MAQDNPQNSNDSGGGNQPAAEQGQVAFALNALKKEYEAAQTDRKEHERKVFRWTRIAGIGVGIYTTLTAIIMAATVYAAMQSKISANAARQSVKISSDTETRQLRAYAYIAPTLPNLQLGKPLDLEIAVRTLGSTLAYDVRTTINAGGSGIPLQSDEYFAVHPSADRCTDFATILDPNTNNHIVHLPVSTFKATPDSLVALQSPNSRLYVWGEMHYRDVFHCQHWTRFCYQIGGTPLHTEECPDRNAVDEDQSCEPNRVLFEPIAPKTPACQRVQ